MSRYEPILVTEAKATAQTKPDTSLSDEVITLCTELQREMRGLKFANKSSHQVWCYFDNHPLTVGYITYGRLQDSTSDEMYGVVSHTITNEKYSDYRKEFNTKMTKSLDTAVKLCKKFLRPHTLLDLNNFCKPEMTYGLQKLASSARDTATHALRAIGDDTLWAELKRLYQTNHEFHDPTLRDKLTQLYEADARAAEVRDKYKSGNGVRMLFVNIAQTASGQRFECAEIKEPPNSWERNFHEASTRVYYDQELPEDTAGALAVLSMLGEKEFVEGVGFKFSDTMYYVEIH